MGLKSALELISIMASKTNILPQPLDLVIGEIGCGDGNGGGVSDFGRCLEEEAFVGGEGKRKRNMLLLGFLLIFGLGLLLCLISEGVWRRRLSWVEKEKEEKRVAPWVLADFWFGFVVVSDFGRFLEEEGFVGGEGKGRET
jgi:hypothetical protein